MEADLAAVTALLGGAIERTEPLAPSGRRNEVLRLTARGRSVVLKRSVSAAREQRMLVQLAPLGLTPRPLALYEESFLMEDLGAGELLEKTLLHVDLNGRGAGGRSAGGCSAAERAAELLIETAQVAGRIHAATRDATLAPVAPAFDTTLGSDGPASRDVERVVEWATGPGPHVAWTTGDFGPDNVWVGDAGVRVFDLEFAAPRQVAIETAAWRAGFPTCGSSASLPGEVVDAMDAAHDAAFGSDLSAERDLAYAALLLGRVARITGWGVLEADFPWGLATGRARLLALLSGFPESRRLGRLRAAALARAEELAALWGMRVVPLPLYPVFE